MASDLKSCGGQIDSMACDLVPSGKKNAVNKKRKVMDTQIVLDKHAAKAEAATGSPLQSGASSEINVQVSLKCSQTLMVKSLQR